MPNTTPQAALLSDDEIERHFEINKSAPGRELRRLIGRSIEADVLAKLQATQAEPVQAGELPDHSYDHYDDFMMEAVKAYTADQMHAYARAALSARKPLTMLEPTQIADACAGVYASDHAGKAYDQAVAMAAITEFCRINGIGLEVKP